MYDAKLVSISYGTNMITKVKGVHYKMTRTQRNGHPILDFPSVYEYLDQSPHAKAEL